MKRTHVLMPIALAAALLAAWPLPADDAATAKAVLDLAGTRQGLCVHLGAGRQGSPALTAELAAQSVMLVHAIALDDASRDRALKAIETHGMPGRASVERVPVPPLPYLADLARIVVVEDPAALAALGVTTDELLRVTQPGGAVCLFADGRWTKTVKPRPKEMDDWTHPHHGADGNLVSAERLARFPAGLRWTDGLVVNAGGFDACRGIAIAGGRLYTLSINEVESLLARAGRGFAEYVSARDAFSGIPLWKLPLGTTYDPTTIGWMNESPIVADDARVYVAFADKTCALDGETGKTAVTYPTRYTARRLALADGVLVASSWKSQERQKLPWTWLEVPVDEGCVEAFDAATGALKWSLPLAALTVRVSNGVVYLRKDTGNPPTLTEILALDLATGRERWRTSSETLGIGANVELNTTGKSFVILSSSKGGLNLILSADDGRVLWKIDKRPSLFTPIVDGLLIQGGQTFDPLTGEAKGTFRHYMPSHGCQMVIMMPPYLMQGWSITEVPAEDAPAGTRGKNYKYDAARGACMHSVIPANGMFYTAQNGCKCNPAQPYGFLAVGPSGEWPVAADFEKPRAVEKGPAFGDVVDRKPDAAEWPTYRATPERSAAVPAALPETLKPLWRVSVAPKRDGPLADAWKAKLDSPVTAPVIAGGRVFVAASDLGQVVALDAADGKRAWTATLPGRIDSPPTISRNVALVGCHDGYVYALRTSDGAMAWRARVAPWERRMVAFGAVESVWPAVGSVLVHDDGVAFTTAGRTSESDGGVAAVALDPVTGEMKWGALIGDGCLRTNDVLALRDGTLAWYHLRIDPRSGKIVAPQPLPTLRDLGGGKGDYSGGVLDGTWTMVRNRRTPYAFEFGKLRANVAAWDDKVIVTPAGAFKRDTQEEIWKTRFGRREQVEAVALGANAVLFAGRNTNASEGTPPAFLVLASLADGKRLADVTLDAPPAYDALALMPGRVILALSDGTVVCYGP